MPNSYCFCNTIVNCAKNVFCKNNKCKKASPTFLLVCLLNSFVAFTNLTLKIVRSQTPLNLQALQNLTQQLRAPHITTHWGVIVSLLFHLYSCKPSQCLNPIWKGIYNLPFWVGTAFVPFLSGFMRSSRTCQSHLYRPQIGMESWLWTSVVFS